MLKVNEDICRGCGLCTRVCPQGAIRVIGGKAQIDTRRCNSCYQCLSVCPQGAISEMVVVSTEELGATVSCLKQQAADIIGRIDQLIAKP
jgi:Fe-S-cluster-containing hydrogenase component 2